jgi:hypothetical protein
VSSRLSAAARTEQRIALLAAGTAPRRLETRAEAQSLLAKVEWSHLIETLRRRRLLPTLGPRIVELTEGGSSEEFAAAVEQALEAGRRHGAFLALVSQRVTAALASAGIRSQPLKGPLMSEAIYGDLGRRLSNDVDLLVPPEQLAAAVQVVRGLGYDPPADRADGDGLPQLHFALVHERGELPPVELHWRIHWYERDFARQRLLPPSIDGADGWRPQPVDELAALLQFYGRDGFVDLRLAADIAAWWDAFGGGLEGGALDEVMSSYPRLKRVLGVGAKVAQRTVGLPATMVMAAPPELDLRERIALRLADPNPRTSEPQLHAEMGLVDGLLTPADDLRAFARRQILEPPQALELGAVAGAEDRGGMRIRYAARVLIRCGVLGRYALAIARAFKPVPQRGRSVRTPAAGSYSP